MHVCVCGLCVDLCLLLCGVTTQSIGYVQAENYMTDIIDAMRGELRNILSKSVDAYSKQPRDKWLFDWPSQIILVVNQIFWCQEVEEAFNKLAHGNVGALKVRHSIGSKHIS